LSTSRKWKPYRHHENGKSDWPLENGKPYQPNENGMPYQPHENGKSYQPHENGNLIDLMKMEILLT